MSYKVKIYNKLSKKGLDNLTKNDASISEEDSSDVILLRDNKLEYI